MTRDAPPHLGTRFLAAVALADELHGDQRRIGTEIPYLAHLLVVTGLVLEDGGDEDEAIAALLHDAAEDAGGRAVLDRIRTRCGSRVADLVEACSDSLDPHDTRSWRERKAAYVAHLPAVDDDGALRVALADKVHNARSIVRDYRAEGHALWERFTNKTPDHQLWYYDELLRFFSARREDRSSRTCGTRQRSSPTSSAPTAAAARRQRRPRTAKSAACGIAPGAFTRSSRSVGVGCEACSRCLLGATS